MARLPRLFIPGCPQHIIQRGHNRMGVFVGEGDRQHYLGWLIDAMRERDVALHAYVLMSNHVHLLVSCATAAASSAVMQSVGRRYAQYFNQRHQRTGTIWEGRFRSTVVASESYVLACYRYIELNPVRAGMVDEPGAYPWSSYLHHVGRRSDPFISDHPLYWTLGNTPFERQAAYERLCAQGMDRGTVELITDTTLKGWSLGERPADSAAPTRRSSRLKPGRPPGVRAAGAQAKQAQQEAARAAGSGPEQERVHEPGPEQQGHKPKRGGETARGREGVPAQGRGYEQSGGHPDRAPRLEGASRFVPVD